MCRVGITRFVAPTEPIAPWLGEAPSRPDAGRFDRRHPHQTYIEPWTGMGGVFLRLASMKSSTTLIVSS